MCLIQLFLLLNVLFHQSVNGDKDIRLPKSIIPVHYNIGIVPDLADGSLQGYVHLEFFVQSPTDRIILHGLNLAVIESSVIVTPLPNSNENDLNLRETPNRLAIIFPVQYNSTREFIIIQLASKLKDNSNYRLVLNYTGTISTNLKGFYRSDYVDQQTGAKK